MDNPGAPVVLPYELWAGLVGVACGRHAVGEEDDAVLVVAGERGGGEREAGL